MAPAGGGGQLEKVFKAAVGFLEEGSLDARTYGKRIIWQVCLPPKPPLVLLHPTALYAVWAASRCNSCTCTYLAHHELESDIMIIVDTICFIVIFILAFHYH